MSVYAVPRERGDVGLWVLSAAIVLALHTTGVALMVQWHEPVVGYDTSDAVLVDLEAPAGPLQQQYQPPPPPPQQRQQKIEPQPTVPNPEAVLESVKPPPKLEEPAPPVQETTAPPPPRPSEAQISAWNREVALWIARHKTYPAAARNRGEVKVVVEFKIGRQGQVVDSRIVDSSGVPALDRETIAMLRRAAPFPAPPSDVPDNALDFVFPIRFNVRQ